MTKPEDKRYSSEIVSIDPLSLVSYAYSKNEIKLHKTCQWCQLLSISQAHYGTATQRTAFSSVVSNSSCSRLFLLSHKCQCEKGS